MSLASGLPSYWLGWPLFSQAALDLSDTSLPSSCSKGSLVSHYMYRARRSLQSYARVACVGVAILYATLSSLGEFYYMRGVEAGPLKEQYLLLARARHVFPLNHWFRTAPGYYVAGKRLAGARLIVIEELEWVLEINPNSPDILLNLAMARLEAGDDEGAERDFARLRQLVPGVSISVTTAEDNSQTGAAHARIP